MSIAVSAFSYVYAVFCKFFWIVVSQLILSAWFSLVFCESRQLKKIARNRIHKIFVYIFICFVNTLSVYFSFFMSVMVILVCFNQTTTGSMLQRAKKQCSAIFTDKVVITFAVTAVSANMTVTVMYAVQSCT